MGMDFLICFINIFFRTTVSHLNIPASYVKVANLSEILKYRKKIDLAFRINIAKWKVNHATENLNENQPSSSQHLSLEKKFVRLQEVK
jgi:hypothetical protein